MSAGPGLEACWYGAADHRPSMSFCPPACNGPTTHAELQGDGRLHRYCDEHAHWRARDVGRQRLRLLRPDELV